MSTKIISAFPGCGKTYFHNNNKNTTLDSDSSHFSWIKDENGNTKALRVGSRTDASTEGNWT